MTTNELHERLDALSNKISEVQKTLKAEASWNDGHRLTSGELDARYQFLKSQLNSELKDAEAHGHHVSNLEASVREWIDSLELKII